MIRLRIALLLAVLLARANAQVVINEVSAAASDRNLLWGADGSPRLGSGTPWNAAAFNDAPWTSGSLPAGWGTTVSTNLQAAMQSKTPTLYLRKTFTATPTQAALTTPLILQVEADDGFVAYVNGVEVARVNCGPAKHFMYVSQPAYNATTTTGLIEYTIGNANTLLVPGTNVLTIEAHNADVASNFRINAGLRLITSSQNVMLTNALYDFSNANGASRTHTNTSGTIANVTAGAPPAGGWLATAANPTSDNTWTSLQIISAEAQGAGLGGSGGMRYSIAQSGTNRGVAIHAPPVSMTGAWAPGSINLPAVAATSLKFRFRTSGDVQFALRLDPALDVSASSMDGFPTVGFPLGGAASSDWTTVIAGVARAALGGFFGKIIDAAGVQQTTLGGAGINLANYDLIIGPGCRSGQVTLKEDNTAGLGPGGTTGVLSFTYNTMPAIVDSIEFSVREVAVANWNPPNILVADFQRSRLSFRWKMPAGRQMTFYVEPNAAVSVPVQATVGTLVGTGNWETFTGTLSDLPGSETLRAKLNTQSTNGKKVKLTAYYAGVNFANGEQVLLDDVRLSYTVPGTEAEEDPANPFSSAAGASRTRTIDGAGAATNATTGTPAYNVTLNSDPAITGFAFRVTEDNTAGAGFNGSKGFLRCDVTDAPDTGAPWGFSLPGLRVFNWIAGSISVADLADVSVQLAVKIPVGVTVQLYAEPVGGSTANRASLGTLTGDGTWQSVVREFATAANVEAFRAALNAATTTTFQLTIVGPNAAPLGDIISLDEPGLLRWRTYQVTLGQGTNQQRFMDYLNPLSSVTFVPAFSKTTAAAATGGSFSIDNFEVSYTGLDPSASTTMIPSGLPGGVWKYFVGVAEPSGGLYDPILLTTNFAPPPGDEGDYSNPQQFQDWVELRNLGASAVNLTNWSMTDDTLYPAKWKFPNGATIPANGYLIVMCDNRNEANGVATYIHSSFSISGGSPKVALYNAAGTLQDQVLNAPGQDSFHTWGRLPDGTGAFGFIDTGTPGAVNAGVFSSARVKQPDFFKADGVTKFSGGFYTGPQTLVITSATAGAQIRYTLDGTDPTETTGSVYSSPITLTPPGDHKSALTVIARAFFSGLVKSDPRAKSYLLDLDANLKGVPSLLFSGDPGRNFFAPAGITAIVDGRPLPVSYDLWTPTGPQSYNIPQGHGDPYERGISAEWYYPDGRAGWREDIGIRISSSPYSRPRLRLRSGANSPWIRDHTEKPSFDLYWRGDYGNSQVRDETMIPGNDVSEYSRLRIRAGKNDISNPFLIDEVGRRLYHDMGWVQPTGTINTLYVNGSFKGMYNTTERLRSQTFQIHYRTINDFDVNYIDSFVDGDAIFWNQMQTSLNTLSASPTLTNYQAAKNYLDAVNVADCFLFWIYVNMDDWPGNNWAAQRERTPGGVYRMATWDMEAAFGRFGKAVNYDTININLINGSSTCGDIFKRLYRSPEFKLLVADRIQRHFFNGGVLDDRGAGSHFQQLINSFTAQVQPLLTYIDNQTVDLGWYNAHINSTTGRRAFLFGGGTGSFQQTQLWPATVPPVFSQLGGVVPAGYQLTITMSAPAGAVIYYTLDGSDPRLPGGGISPGALTYSGPVTLSFLGTVNARIRLADGTWSALNSAYFEPAAAQPTGNTLVISELNYHPSDPSAAEFAVHFQTSDDFEFIRLTNVGVTPIDLRKLRFTQGITYDFTNSAVGAINPGASVLVVRNKDGFQYRYGTSYNASIAGEYAGTFSNSGETVTLQLVNGSTSSTLETFTFGAAAPWPKTPDGYGPTLMLANPAIAPNPQDPASWTASAEMGGMPGGVPRPQTYAAWKLLAFSLLDAADASVSGPTADPDRDGLTNFTEYSIGCVPTYPDSAPPLATAQIENITGTTYLTYQYRLMGGATDATVTPEITSDLFTWLNGAANIVTLAGPTTSPNGAVTWKVRDINPFTTPGRRQFHLKMTGP